MKRFHGCARTSTRVRGQRYTPSQTRAVGQTSSREETGAEGNLSVGEILVPSEDTWHQGFGVLAAGCSA